MTNIGHLQMLAQYRAWADGLLYQSLAKLPNDELVREYPIVFGNLIRTLHHVYCMDQVWRSHLQGVPHGFTTRNPVDCPDFAALRSSQLAMDEWYVQCASALDETACNEVIHFTFIGGGEGSMRREDILLHVVNHATYHRGHVAAMMYGKSVPPPTTDLPVFLREMTLKRTAS